MRNVPVAPSEGTWPLEEFYQRLIQLVTPSVESKLRVHRLLIEYIDSPDAVFIVRGRSETRRKTIVTSHGVSIRPSDNSPAWWMHDVTFRDRDFEDLDAFTVALHNVPVHIHDAGSVNGINRARWYVAHLIPAKLGRIRPDDFTRDEASAAFLRNVHPFNHFYLPIKEARKYEADPRVLSFFVDRARETFGREWQEFVNRLGGEASAWLARLPAPSSSMDYTLDGDAERPRVASTPTGVAAEYRKGRLWFMADVIEPLRMEDRFRIVTPDGVFEMSKADFYRVFDNVVSSVSYQRDRHYHSKSAPKKADAFRVA